MNLTVRFALLATTMTMMACESSTPASDTVGRGCVERPSNTYGILGGETVSDSDPLAKRLVLLLMKTPEGIKSCTGTPISENVILTAAHCVDDASTVRVAFKTNAYCDTGFQMASSTVQAEKVVPHPDYSSSVLGKNDLALVKLSSRIPSDYLVSPLMKEDTSLSSSQVILSGYGKTTESEDSLLELRTVRKELGSDTFVFKDEPTQLRFDQRDARGVCSGDSGGPVFFETNYGLILGGVNSAVSGRTEETVCRGSGTAMFVPAFANWIQTELSKLK